VLGSDKIIFFTATGSFGLKNIYGVLDVNEEEVVYILLEFKSSGTNNFKNSFVITIGSGISHFSLKICFFEYFTF
jgi:hypothetical protein